MKHLILGLALLASVAYTRRAMAENALGNSGFETGVLEPWYHEAGIGSEDWEATDAGAHSGLFSATTVGHNIIRQDFDPIAVDEINRVSFWIKQPFESAARNFFGVGYHFSPDSSSTHSGFHRLVGGHWEYWDDTSFLKKPRPADAHLIGLSIHGGYHGIRTFLDDVRIIRNSSTHVLTVGVRDDPTGHRGDVGAQKVAAAFTNYKSVDSITSVLLNTSDTDSRARIEDAISKIEDQLSPGDSFVL